MMNKAAKYASELKKRILEGENGNDLLMYFANKLAMETKNSYADCKEAIAFCYKGL